MNRDTFLLTIKNLLDNVEDERNILSNATELMDELYALIDRPTRYRRAVIKEWKLALKEEEINALSDQLSTAMGILQFMDQTIHKLVDQGQIRYKSEPVF